MVFLFSFIISSVLKKLLQIDFQEFFGKKASGPYFLRSGCQLVKEVCFLQVLQ